MILLTSIVSDITYLFQTSIVSDITYLFQTSIVSDTTHISAYNFSNISQSISHQPPLFFPLSFISLFNLTANYKRVENQTTQYDITPLEMKLYKRL